MRLSRILIAAAITITAASGATAPAAAAPSTAMDNDFSCLARNVYHEARGEDAVGMVAVGYVVLNRARDGRDLCEVVKERWRGSCQFSWVCDRRASVREQESWARSKAVAAALVGASPPPDPTHGATHFARCASSAAWRRSYERTARIGSHCFYRQREAVASAPRGREPPRPLPAYGIVEDGSRPHGYTLVVWPGPRPAPGAVPGPAADDIKENLSVTPRKRQNKSLQ